MEKINWYGTYCLSIREVKRFLVVYNQTIISPIVSGLIFLAIITLSSNAGKTHISGVKFIDFIGYGLIIMSMIQNSFASSSSSLIMYKVLRYIADILVTPFGGTEIVLAFTIAAVIRGVMVGISVAIALSPFIEYTLAHPLLLIFYTLASCAFLGQLGIISGLIANSFDQSSAITSYLITPLSFLSGTVYSVSSLPVIYQKINLFNPFFYIIDGFRYCFTNHTDGDVITGSVLLIAANISLSFLLVTLINNGWRIKT